MEKGYSLGSADTTGLPKIHGLPTSSFYTTSSGSTESYTASPKNPKSRKSSHSGELQFPLHADSNGGGRSYMPGLYPSVDAWKPEGGPGRSEKHFSRVWIVVITSHYIHYIHLCHTMELVRWGEWIFILLTECETPDVDHIPLASIYFLSEYTKFIVLHCSNRTIQELVIVAEIIAIIILIPQPLPFFGPFFTGFADLDEVLGIKVKLVERPVYSNDFFLWGV